MKKKICVLLLVMSLALGLTFPAVAYDMGKAGQTNPVSAGWRHTAAIMSDGSLWTWGNDEYYQLGNGTTEDSTAPVNVMKDVTAVSAGGFHTAAIMSDGSLWTWGSNSRHQLGKTTDLHYHVPLKVMEDVTAVSAGGFYTAAIKTDGSLWTWGENDVGQLGNGATYSYISYAVPVKVMEDVTTVSAGRNHTAAIRADSSLWAWGHNYFGQLGDGTTKDSAVPIKVMDNVTAVSTGGSHTAIIKTDGSLWTWGNNSNGQLGNGTTGKSVVPVKVMDNVTAVSAGVWHTAAIAADGSLWVWGGNAHGQLGNGTTEQSVTPVKVMDNVTSVSAGEYHTIATTMDGAIWIWGENTYGQLGNGSTENSTVPLKMVTPDLPMFTDEDSIDYITAVQTLSNLGIITGYDDGAFHPQNSLTRAQACVILTRMLRQGNVSAGYSPFSDVATDSWYGGAIAYCYEQGIVNGVGDGRFAPDDTLSDAAWVKMLLGALGYNAETEGMTGENWINNVYMLMRSAGLSGGLPADFSLLMTNLDGQRVQTPISRETACQMALNTLNAGMVSYENGFGYTGTTFAQVYWPDAYIPQ